MLFSLFLAWLLGAPAGSAAQEPRAEIAAVVSALFEAMRAGDGTAAAQLFHPEARLQSVSEQNGASSLRSDAIADFIDAVGAPRTQIWDERIRDLEIQVDGSLATAWMHYAFYVDDTFSHCGVNAFQLFRDEGGWKIIQITDTRRTDGCEGAG